jgi:hypothetical protein
MARVTVRLLDPTTPAGGSVVIKAETDTPLLEIKRQLHLKTGESGVERG